MSDKQDYIVKLEKAISEKYGEEATHNPRRYWDEDKEKEYIQQSKVGQNRSRRIFNKQKTT
jgi:hypothetical protein